MCRICNKADGLDICYDCRTEIWTTVFKIRKLLNKRTGALKELNLLRLKLEKMGVTIEGSQIKLKEKNHSHLHDK